MSMVGIIAISLLAGMFILALLVGLGVLLWSSFKLRGVTADMQKQGAAVYAETRAALTGYQAEIKAAIDSAKTSFAAVRTETRTILEEHRKQMQAGIDKINAEALQGAAARSLQACMRLEKIAGVLQQLFTENETRVTHDYAPEEFAPEENRFTGPPSAFGLSQTAVMDAEDEAARVMDVQTETVQES